MCWCFIHDLILQFAGYGTLSCLGDYQNFSRIWFLHLQNIQEALSNAQYVTESNQIDVM